MNSQSTETNNSFTPVHDNDLQDETRPPVGTEELVQQIKDTADKLLSDRTPRGDVKLLATAVRELRYSFKRFEAFRGRRKVTVFGSARTKPDHPAYASAVEFGRRMAAHDFMVITGAASGIMEAGHVGAGRDHSVGVNIMLPFEQGANQVIRGDRDRLMTLKYFFTRKLMFLKESDAVVLYPGGFGTHDEGFEVLTLLQTGKSHMFPVVMVDHPGGTYWKNWETFIEQNLLANRYISPADRALWRVTDSVDDAVDEVCKFYRVYHSMRYVKKDLVLRLQQRLSEALMDRLRAEFADIVVAGDMEQTGPLPAEENETHLAHLSRLKFRFDRHGLGRLRMLIDVINNEG